MTFRADLRLEIARLEKDLAIERAAVKKYALRVAREHGKVDQLEAERAALRDFTESMAIIFRNYYSHAISREAVDAKLQEWIELRKNLAPAPSAPQAETE